MIKKILFLLITLALIQSQSLTITYPNGGEELVAGSTIDIVWTTQGSVPIIDLSYSDDNGVTWNVLDTEFENTGTFAWHIPHHVDAAYNLIKIYENGDGSPYDISNGPFSIISNCPDVQEPNDSPTEAFPMEFGVQYDGCFNGLVNNAYDFDYFTFNSGEEGGLYILTILIESVGSDTQTATAYMLFAGFDTIYDGSDMQISGMITLLDYDISIYVYGLEAGNYSIMLEKFEIEECDDSYEPNNSFAEADTIYYNQTVSGCLPDLEDEDYFTFSADFGQTIISEVLIENTGSTLEGYHLQLWYGTDELVYDNYDATFGTNIAITHYVVQTGDYYIRLFTEGVPGTYQLHLYEIETYGCMDENACNYNPLATINDESCAYQFDECGECGGNGPMDGYDCNDNLYAHDLKINNYEITQIYPNPFNPKTNINYTVPNPSQINLSIYNVAGIFVETLVDDYMVAGNYTTHWNASAYPSGSYLIKLKSKESQQVKKLLLIK